mgnify:CR=1 FL=1
MYSLSFLLIGIVALYIRALFFFPEMNYVFFVFATLFLPGAFILASFYSRKPSFSTVYTMHYFGLAFMVYMTLRSVFGLQGFSQGFQPGIVHISLLLMLESLIWYLSWIRIYKLERETLP